MELDRWEYILRSILGILINILTLFGNSIVLLAFYRFKSIRSIPNLFILNLTITDFLQGLLVMPFVTTAIIARGWKCGDFLCNFQGAVTVIINVASVFTLTFVSLERKLAICNPWHHYLWFNSRKVAVLFGVNWFSCFLVALTGFFSPRYVFKPQFMTCMVDWSKTFWFTIYATTLHFFLPFLLVYSNVSILKVLRGRQRVMSKCSQQGYRRNAQTRRTNREKKAWKMLLTVVLAFFVCWAPYYSSVVCSTLFHEACPIAKKNNFYVVLFVGVNSCVNPIVYCAMNNSFRQVFSRLLHCQTNSSRKRIAKSKPVACCREERNA